MNPNCHSGALTITLPARRPLLDLWTVCTLLDLKDREVLSLIENGDLPWVWDIRGSGAETKRCLRILAKDVAALQKGQKPKGDEDDQVIIRSFIPVAVATLKASDLARIFNCSNDHITGRLLRDGSLVRWPSAVREKQSPEVSRDSIVRFLIKRRVF